MIWWRHGTNLWHNRATSKRSFRKTDETGQLNLIASLITLHGKAKANPQSSYNILNIVDGSETIMSDRSPMAIHGIEEIQHLLDVSIWDSPISSLY